MTTTIALILGGAAVLTWLLHREGRRLRQKREYEAALARRDQALAGVRRIRVQLVFDATEAIAAIKKANVAVQKLGEALDKLRPEIKGDDQWAPLLAGCAVTYMPRNGRRRSPASSRARSAWIPLRLWPEARSSPSPSPRPSSCPSR